MIKIIYAINGGDIIIDFENGKSVLLRGTNNGFNGPEWRKRYRDELKDTEKTKIKIERDYSKSASNIDEFYEIEKIGNDYYLLISGQVENYKIQISPGELKFLLFLNSEMNNNG